MPARSPSGTLRECQVIDGQHRVRLAAAEGRLQLDDWLAAFAVEPLRHLDEQHAHALGDEGALEERLRVTVFRRRLARVHGGDVGSKLGLLERAFSTSGWGTTISRQGFRLMTSVPLAFKERSLVARQVRHAGGGGFDAAPARDEFVVGAGVFGPAEAFAEGVEAVGELAGGFGFAADGGEELRRRRIRRLASGRG